MNNNKIDKAIEAMNESVSNKSIEDRIQEDIDINQGKIIGKEISFSNKGIKERMLKPEEVLAMPEKTVNTSPYNRKVENKDKLGRFLPGNQAARGNKSVKLDKDALIEAMKTVENLKKKPFLENVFEMAYKYPQVMNKILDKFFADLSIAELRGNSGAWNVFITQFIEEKREKKAIEEIELNDRPEMVKGVITTQKLKPL